MRLYLCPPSLSPPPPLPPHTQILQEVEENGIKIYEFPDTDGDVEEAAANKKLRVGQPCASTLYALDHKPALRVK